MLLCSISSARSLVTCHSSCFCVLRILISSYASAAANLLVARFCTMKKDIQGGSVNVFEIEAWARERTGPEAGAGLRRGACLRVGAGHSIGPRAGTAIGATKSRSTSCLTSATACMYSDKNVPCHPPWIPDIADGSTLIRTFPSSFYTLAVGVPPSPHNHIHHIESRFWQALIII